MVNHVGLLAEKGCDDGSWLDGQLLEIPYQSRWQSACSDWSTAIEIEPGDSFLGRDFLTKHQ